MQALRTRLLQLEREFERGAVPPVPTDALALHVSDLMEHEEAVLACAICRRDHPVMLGREVVTPTGEPVCWPCARQLDPELAAEAITYAADAAERGAANFADQSTTYHLATLRRHGNHERARALERAMEEVQALARLSRERGYGAPETWLAS